MTATLTTALTRLVLNITRNEGDKGSWMNLLGAYPGIDRGVVYGLIDAKLLTGPDRELLESGSSSREADYHFHLTVAGRSWLDTDPVSVTCRPIRDAPQMRLNLAAYLRILGGDKDMVKSAHDEGYIRCSYAGDGAPSKTLGDYELRHAGDFAVHSTEKLRRAVG